MDVFWGVCQGKTRQVGKNFPKHCHVTYFKYTKRTLKFLKHPYRAFGKPVLELSPEGIAITVACFGRRRTKKTERIPIAELRESDITVRMEGKNPAIAIQHAKRTLSIGAANVKLSQAEAEWLRSEILDYVSTMTGRTSL